MKKNETPAKDREEKYFYEEFEPFPNTEIFFIKKLKRIHKGKNLFVDEIIFGNISKTKIWIKIFYTVDK